MRIRELRTARGLNTAALARTAGVTTSAARGWEIGTKTPTTDKLPLIAAILECEVGDLYDEAELARASELATEKVREEAVRAARRMAKEV